MFKKILEVGSLILLVVLVFATKSRSQDAFNQFNNEGLIQIAEPGQLADTLNLWGDIRNPGRYRVPQNISLPELISYARGPITSDAGERKVKGIEVFILRYSSTTNRELVKEFRFKPNEPLPGELRKYGLKNNDTISIKVQRKRSFFQGLRNVTPFVTLIITGILAYDRLSANQ